MKQVWGIDGSTMERRRFAGGRELLQEREGADPMKCWQREVLGRLQQSSLLGAAAARRPLQTPPLPALGREKPQRSGRRATAAASSGGRAICALRLPVFPAHLPFVETTIRTTA